MVFEIWNGEEEGKDLHFTRDVTTIEAGTYEEAFDKMFDSGWAMEDGQLFFIAQAHGYGRLFRANMAPTPEQVVSIAE